MEARSSAGLQRVLLAAAAGALALDLLAPLERHLAGRVPPFAASRVAARLAPRWPPLLLGTVLRFGWSALWSAPLAAAAASPRLRATRAAAAVPLVLLLVERWLLPATGATPPWRAWPPLERALLLSHVGAWTVGVTLAARWQAGVRWQGRVTDA